MIKQIYSSLSVHLRGSGASKMVWCIRLIKPTNIGGTRFSLFSKKNPTKHCSYFQPRCITCKLQEVGWVPPSSKFPMFCLDPKYAHTYYTVWKEIGLHLKWEKKFSNEFTFAGESNFLICSKLQYVPTSRCNSLLQLQQPQVLHQLPWFPCWKIFLFLSELIHFLIKHSVI